MNYIITSVRDSLPMWLLRQTDGGQVVPGKTQPARRGQESPTDFGRFYIRGKMSGAVIKPGLCIRNKENDGYWNVFISYDYFGTGINSKWRVFKQNFAEVYFTVVVSFCSISLLFLSNRNNRKNRFSAKPNRF